MAVEVSPAEAIVMETPGAGGYGAPAERDRAALRADFVSGKFSRDYLKRHYGFDPDADEGAKGTEGPAE